MGKSDEQAWGELGERQQPSDPDSCRRCKVQARFFTRVNSRHKLVLLTYSRRLVAVIAGYLDVGLVRWGVQGSDDGHIHPAVTTAGAGNRGCRRVGWTTALNAGPPGGTLVAASTLRTPCPWYTCIAVAVAFCSHGWFSRNLLLSPVFASLGEGTISRGRNPSNGLGKPRVPIWETLSCHPDMVICLTFWEEPRICVHAARADVSSQESAPYYDSPTGGVIDEGRQERGTL